MPDLPVLHHLLKFAQVHVHCIVMPSSHLILWCPLLFLPSIFPSNRAFSSGSGVHIRWPNYWSFSFSISPSNEHSVLLKNQLVWSPCCPRDSQESSPAPLSEGINSLVHCLLYSPVLTTVHDHCEDYSLDYTDPEKHLFLLYWLCQSLWLCGSPQTVENS